MPAILFDRQSAYPFESNYKFCVYFSPFVCLSVRILSVYVSIRPSVKCKSR